MRLDGKTAFVTGADSGIGRAIAMTFAREGADVAIHWFEDQRGVEQTAHAIQQHGRRAEVLQADFTDPATAEGMIAEVVSRLGKVDILVNNAGMGEGAETSLEIAADDAFQRVLNVDTGSTFFADGGLMQKVGLA